MASFYESCVARTQNSDAIIHDPCKGHRRNTTFVPVLACNAGSHTSDRRILSIGDKGSKACRVRCEVVREINEDLSVVGKSVESMRRYRFYD